MVEPGRPSSRMPPHRCTYVDAETGDAVAEVIAADDWHSPGLSPMRRGRWYRCSRNCGVFIYVPPTGEVNRLRLLPGATLDMAKRRLARARRRSPPN